MKKIFPNSQVFSRFSLTVSAEGENSNHTVSFLQDILKSYQTVIARKLKSGDPAEGEKYAWVSTEKYSTTTSKHQGQCAMALRSAGWKVLRSPVCPVNRLPSLRAAWKHQQEADKKREAQAKVEQEASCGSCGGTIADDSHEIARAESEGMPSREAAADREADESEH
jgi:hypothetical protein